MTRTGDCLLSSGDDGAVRFWKKSLSGEWLEFAETNMADEYVPSSSNFPHNSQCNHLFGKQADIDKVALEHMKNVF